MVLLLLDWGLKITCLQLVFLFFNNFFSYVRCAIVEELAGFGAVVHTCSRNKKELDEKIQEWEAKGFKVTGSVCDLFSKEQREELIQTVSSVFEGKLNMLVSSLTNFFFFWFLSVRCSIRVFLYLDSRGWLKKK